MIAFPVHTGEDLWPLPERGPVGLRLFNVALPDQKFIPTGNFLDEDSTRIDLRLRSPLALVSQVDSARMAEQSLHLILERSCCGRNNMLFRSRYPEPSKSAQTCGRISRRAFRQQT
jgi:hypothetical protein